MIRSDERPAKPFVAWAQQREAARLGMWLFLASEAMMFGSLIIVAWLFRLRHPEGVAEAVEGLHYLLASVNTVLLLTSSLLMTLAASEPRRVRQCLLGAAMLGALFLGCKGVEYALEIHEGVLPGFADHSRWQAPSAQLFMNLYFIATALHGLHVLIAIGLALWLYSALKRNRLAPRQAAMRLEMISLYWHLVDGIWILLFPTLYLVGR